MLPLVPHPHTRLSEGVDIATHRVMADTGELGELHWVPQLQECVGGATSRPDLDQFVVPTVNDVDRHRAHMVERIVAGPARDRDRS